MNPTSSSYVFAWLCEDTVSEAQPQSPFKCLSPSGSVEAGKKKEVSCAMSSACSRHVTGTSGEGGRERHGAVWGGCVS